MKTEELIPETKTYSVAKEWFKSRFDRDADMSTEDGNIVFGFVVGYDMAENIYIGLIKHKNEQG